MQPPTWPAAELESPAQARPGCLDYLVFAVAGTWIVIITVLLQIGAWYYDQSQLAQDAPSPGWFWLVIALAQAILAGGPALLLAVFMRAPQFRAAYRAWAWAIGFGLLLSLARLCPITWTQPAAVVQIGLSLLAALVLTRFSAKTPDLPGDLPRARSTFRKAQLALLACALALLVALPWLKDGALGSPTDTVLNGIAALALGLFAGLLIEQLLIPLLAAQAGAAREIGFGGLAAGVALLALGAGFGYGGSQIPLMITLAALGGAAVALGRWARMTGDGWVWLPIACLVGLAAAGPLLLIDPDEFSVLLGNTEVGLVFQSARYSLLIATLIGLVLWLLGPRLSWPPRPALALGGLAAAGLLAALVYFFAGQPGFYGERFFVILRDQADLSPASQIASREDRLRFVYTRLTDQANRSQASLRTTLDRLGVSYRPYYLVNGLEVNGGPLLRAYIAAQPEVDRILESPHLRPLPVPVTPETGQAPPPNGPQWNIIAIGADRVWDELHVDGSGIVVGESDSGVQGDHPALRDGYRGRNGQDDFNWLDPWFGSRSPTDVGGHGTHTTGTIVGRGGIGVAPGAQWMGCVNLGRNLANPAFYLDCMQFMLAPYPQAGDPLKDGDPARAAHVLNNSWGCPPLEGCDAGALEPAVRALRAAGIFVVASAGNEGPECGSVSDPIAIYDAAWSVGAIDQDGNIADFSSRGPVAIDGSNRVKPDLVAPGVDVLSALPGSSYGKNSGTSMAGPHVAGVVALMWSAQPKLIGQIDRTEQLLAETARPYEGVRSGCFEGGTPSDATGYGVVDAYAAVKAALAEP